MYKHTISSDILLGQLFWNGRNFGTLILETFLCSVVPLLRMGGCRYNAKVLGNGVMFQKHAMYDY